MNYREFISQTKGEVNNFPSKHNPNSIVRTLTYRVEVDGVLYEVEFRKVGNSNKRRFRIGGQGLSKNKFKEQLTTLK
jgi:hypothetical protein